MKQRQSFGEHFSAILLKHYALVPAIWPGHIYSGIDLSEIRGNLTPPNANGFTHMINGCELIDSFYRGRPVVFPSLPAVWPSDECDWRWQMMEHVDNVLLTWIGSFVWMNKLVCSTSKYMNQKVRLTLPWRGNTAQHIITQTDWMKSMKGTVHPKLSFHPVSRLLLSRQRAQDTGHSRIQLMLQSNLILSFTTNNVKHVLSQSTRWGLLAGAAIPLHTAESDVLNSDALHMNVLVVVSIGSSPFICVNAESCFYCHI